ncbi:hypothetical protein CFK37_12500 [Virgibacillus phasianinus]|uniref:Uncharacterized protein n=1 Tax=Virgibacillus phasianinus TaxID=2017483 RepID=A0A220U8Y2_9BACI|nr:hypothetical protein CFK37_12500 [Virgibacillus phasianinus]
MVLLPISLQAETKSKTPESTTIHTYKEDVTGDDQKETVVLKAIPFSKDSSYYQKIWAVIKDSRSKKWEVQYGGGYEPTLQFYDLNHDDVTDIYYQSPTGGSGGLYSYQLNTLKDEKLTKIELPVQRYVKGKFLENFRVFISLTPGNKPIYVDVKDRTNAYTRLGIYNKNGALLKPASLMIDPIAFYEPVLISKSKGYGLKSYQQISGAYHADQLGTIETLWYFEKGKWIILTTKWVPLEQ